MMRFFALSFAGCVACLALPAHAIPAFARKYGTSCTTCHTVYPKLTPFGEAYRRNGFRFPGVDSDYVKQDTITMRPKAGSFAQATLPSQAPLAFGFNGQATFHPDKNSGGGQADNSAQVVITDLVAEGHLWAGGSFSDTATFFGEVTAVSDGTVDVEHAQIYFNDLIGPQHAVNVRIGRGFSNVSSFGPHSSFLTDALIPATPVAALAGASGGGWNLTDHYNGIEVSGVVASGRVGYNAGWNAGSNLNVSSAEDVYGHVGVKLGGMRLDGEGASATSAERPWEETAITFDAFAYHARTSLTFAAPTAGDPDIFLRDTATVFGGGVRAQWNSLELNVGIYSENHLHAQADGTSATALAQYNELGYIVFPWLVPALRVELTKFSPDGAPSVTDTRIMPGVAIMPYPNLKLTVVALLEASSGAPPGTWREVGGFAAPADPAASTSLELQAVVVGLAAAF